MASELRGAEVKNTLRPNEPISLGKQKIEVMIAGDPTQLDASMALRLLPSPRLVIEAQGTTSRFGGIDQVGPVARLLPAGLKIPVNPESFSFSFDRTVRLALSPQKEPIAILSTKRRIKSVQFSVINFPNVFGAHHKMETNERGEKHHLGGVQLNAGHWSVDVIAVPGLDDTFKELKKTSGYAITHTGTVSRHGHTFSNEEAKHLLEGLRLFLSFARGSFCSTTLQTGYDRKGKECWKQVGSHIVTPWAYTPSWFDSMHGKILSEVFPGFWNRFNDPDWADTINAAIYWYLRSNTLSAGVDGGLILNQSALERISSVCLARQSGRASDLIRQTLIAMRIGTRIPLRCRELRSLARKSNWQDAPHALTEVRNQLVHPKQKYGKMPSRVYYEAWSLGQRYLELMLLRLFNHRGKHANRLTQQWRGQVVGVPWR